MSDQFKTHSTSLESPASGLLAVTPDDDADLACASRALNVGQSGYVAVTTVRGSVGTVYIAAGTPFPIRVSRVWATGTTATDIVALF